MQATCGMNGSNGIVQGSLCFAPLDEIMQTVPLAIQPLVMTDGGHQYPDDPIERMLDRYGIEGAAINAAELDEATV